MKLADKLGITYQAMRGWHDKNRMPDTEYSGRTHHAVNIQVETDSAVTVTMMLGHVPVAAQQFADKKNIEIS